MRKKDKQLSEVVKILSEPFQKLNTNPPIMKFVTGEVKETDWFDSHIPGHKVKLLYVRYKDEYIYSVISLPYKLFRTLSKKQFNEVYLEEKANALNALNNLLKGKL